MRFQQTCWAAAKATIFVGLLAAAAATPAIAKKYGENQTCGGLTGGEACPAGTFCQNPAGTCKGADIRGTCVKVPKICNKIFMPVCGCDGKTYSNDCEREAAKVSKDHDGKCT